LVGKVGALVAEPPPMPSAPTSDEDYDSVRGKFPDYVNRKVIYEIITISNEIY
jgi:hypothetical protein